MITLSEAERIAEGWAEKQSRWRGYACTPHVDELALGYAVWMRLPPDVRTEPGQDVTTIIDRDTGRLSHWPPAPLDELDRRYSERRDAAIGSHQTADPVAELWREAFRRVSPAVAAHVTLGGRLFRARGAKGDQELRHHPIVAELLGMVPAGRMVRGADRHAELLVVSDVLYEADRARAAGGQAPLTLDEARNLLEQGVFETFHIRETGDPLGGQPAGLCATCSDILFVLFVIPAGQRTYVDAQRELSIGGGSIRHLADPLEEFGIILEAEVSPLGVEGADEAVLVIDDRGRVFALDQGGEWFIAETMDEALVALSDGHPAARIRNDGTWESA